MAQRCRSTTIIWREQLWRRRRAEWRWPMSTLWHNQLPCSGTGHGTKSFTTGGDNVAATLTFVDYPSCVSPEPTVVDNGNSSYQASLIPECSGNNLVSVSINGETIKNVPKHAWLNKACLIKSWHGLFKGGLIWITKSVEMWSTMFNTLSSVKKYTRTALMREEGSPEYSCHKFVHF